MPEPRMRDVRDGLTPAAIADLRGADRVQVGVKDAHTAVLGLWPPAGARERLTVLVIRAFWLGPSEPEPRGPLDMLGPVRGGPWEQIAAALQPGDRLTLIDRDRRGAWLRREAEGNTGATYRLTVRGARWRPASPAG